MVYRVYVEKKEGLAAEATALFKEISEQLNIQSVEKVRVLNRYDLENISSELFEYAKGTVLSEPAVDRVYEDPDLSGARLFCVEYLPGQFDQRADSAMQCIRIIDSREDLVVRTAKVYALYGQISDQELNAIKSYLINPVEAREAALDLPDSLQVTIDQPEPIEVLEGFRRLDEDGLDQFIADYGLAMDRDDLVCCRDYFRSEDRDPTITEIRMIDTYWSDHCRHTTFQTIIDSVHFEDELLQEAYEDYLETRKKINRTGPITFMDIGTLAGRYLRATGKLDKLDLSEEINACTVKIRVDVDGVSEPWLLLFKNETHNHPTEIEPFGGAATCIGGAIRDPLSGRAYVYAAMRLTGAGDPRLPFRETMEGKLPQRTIVTKAAEGYSSYGNQIGVATGLVDELYHPGYVAKRMEIGAVIGASPESEVRREKPIAGDRVILLGGRTGRDGIGGATGSSKAHDLESVEKSGAEVQKGNAPEERKLQRLFRHPEASRLIKRCNDFGAGGVSVAIGELAEGLAIDLDRVPEKYEGLDGTELAISESQERMAVVVDAGDVDRFLELADRENLEATVVAEVTDSGRLTMTWRGDKIVDLSRDFLDTNGADKHIEIEAALARPLGEFSFFEPALNWETAVRTMVSDLNVCSKKGLVDRFDSTIGAGTILMPFGGKYQRTPIQAMVHKISLEKGDTDDCSMMSWGFNPYMTEYSPFHGAYLAVIESVSKLIATGADFRDIYLSFQEYFEKPGRDPKRWGKPLSALLGAFKAQMDLEIAAIGGKDSMSGSFEDLDVPPSLVSFAVTTQKVERIVSPELKRTDSRVLLLRPEVDESGLPVRESLLKLFDRVIDLLKTGKAVSCYTPTMGGVAEAVWKMGLGNEIGFAFTEEIPIDELFRPAYASFILEMEDGAETVVGDGIQLLGHTHPDFVFAYGDRILDGHDLLKDYEGVLEGVYPSRPEGGGASPTDRKVFFDREGAVSCPSSSAGVLTAKPTILIPVFPGTNCEYDTAKAVEAAGGHADIFIIRNLTADHIERTIADFAHRLDGVQAIFIPGGFSGGDEPDGSGKFITAFFRNPAIREGVDRLLNRRDGLIGGVCNGFQALIKLGLISHGQIMDMDEDSPTLTFNTIGRHQSMIVQTKLLSNRSPWLTLAEPGRTYSVPISHGEGRIYADEKWLTKLFERDQVFSQYVDLDGQPARDLPYNPNGSAMAIEGLCSPDGRVLGKMGHSERIGRGLYKNVVGDYDIRLFESAVKYFKG